MIKLPPKRGSIVICDFESMGCIEPEMQKKRPAVVISPKFRERVGICTIVPLSTSAPRKPQKYHHLLTFHKPLSSHFAATDMWVKADMIYAVSYERLSFVAKGRKPCGKRIYDYRIVSEKDMEAITKAAIFSISE